MTSPTGPSLAADYTDLARPHPDGVWNWLNGGKDYRLVDEDIAVELTRRFPALEDQPPHFEAFKLRLLQFLVDDGIRQLLVVGTGYPARDPVHAVAQRDAPVRVAYTDDDPMTVMHARVMFPGADYLPCQHLLAADDDVDAIVAAAAQLLDFAQPVAVLLSRLARLPDDEAARAVVDGFGARLAAGSRVVVTHPTGRVAGSGIPELLAALRGGGVPVKERSLGQIAELMSGLELLAPGVVPVARWRPDPPPWPPPRDIDFAVGIGARL